MTSVITDTCIKCKHMKCVEVCPIDAFHEGENMLVINPLHCTDCLCCIAECPIDAIAHDSDPRAEPWLGLNAQYSQLWPNVTADRGQTPRDADLFGSLTGKFDHFFSPRPGKGDAEPPVGHLPSPAQSRQGQVSARERMKRMFRRRLE